MPDTDATALRPEDRRRTLAYVLVGNLVMLAGVAALGWPPGDVLVLFWADGVLLGVYTLIRILTARRPPIRRRPLFFLVHYGLFSFVHGIFIAGTVLFLNGVEAGALTLALAVPLGLLVVRYLAELGHEWVLRGGRDRTTPEEAFWAPYPRMMIQHVVVIVCWGLMLTFLGPSARGRPTVFDSIPGLDTLAPGTVMVGALVLIKTIGDVLFATRTVRVSAS